jgi:hypothetical protein
VPFLCNYSQRQLTIKKGQAAIEFLTTYGWALFALVIVLVVLFSTGIFSPSYLVNEECTFGNNLKCNAGFYNSEGSTRLALTLFNGFPYKIRISDMMLQTQDGSQGFTGLPHDVELESGANISVQATFTGTMIPSDSLKRLVGNITYVSCAPEIGTDCSDVEHIITGRVTARVTK